MNKNNIDKELYKQFMIDKNKNNNSPKIIYNYTPATTIANTITKSIKNDEQKSMVSFSDKPINNSNNKMRKKFINKIVKQHIKPQNSFDNSFDKMVENMNKVENEVYDSSSNLINNRYIIDIDDIDDIDDTSNNIKTKSIIHNTSNPLLVNNIIDNSSNIIYAKKENKLIKTPSYDSFNISSIDSIPQEHILEFKLYKENYEKSFNKDNSNNSILYNRNFDKYNNSIDTNELKNQQKKGNSVITGSSSSFSFKTPEIPVDPKDLECCNKIFNRCCCSKFMDFINKCKIFSREKSGDLVILIDKDMMNMLHYSLSSSIISNYKYIRYLLPILTNIIFLISALFTYAYPDSFTNDYLIWSMYFTSMLFCYNYLFYLVSNWNIQKHYIERNIQSNYRKISYTFYYLFTIFFFYYSGKHFINNHNNTNNDIGDNTKHKINDYYFINYIYYFGLYLFFTTCGACFYFVTTKLIQKGNMLHKWLHELKLRKPPIDEFYNQYNKFYKKIKFFAKYWNILIFLGFIMLTFTIPFDIISIIYYKNYFNFASVIIRSILLSWYTYCICYYNRYEKYIPSYLYKHRIYRQHTIKGIEKYMVYRPIGLNFYGFTINGTLIMKSIVLLFNIILPTIYGIISNKVISFDN
jgi:hypothetical protein